MKTESNVATKSKAVLEMESNIALTTALMGGTKAMRNAATAYLPQWPAENTDAYKVRLAMATLFPAYSRTVQTLTGKPFSKPITYEKGTPTVLQEMMEDDADLQGRNLDAFAACVLECALAHGGCGILVDVPKLEKVLRDDMKQSGRVLSQAEEKALGIRPYLVMIDLSNIIGWRSERKNGVETLTQLRFYETVEEADGEFAMKEIKQVRVLEPGKWAIWRKGENAERDEWIEHDSGVTSLTAIPFVMVYGKRTGFMTSTPPMLEMAHLNVKHWQSQSDQDNILHVARVPILTAMGVDDTFKLAVGASTAVVLPIGAALQYVEHSGSCVGVGRQALEDLKEEMRQAGAELLVLQPGEITATQVASENAVGMCVLQRITENLEDALDTALQFCADFMRVGDGGSVVLFKDFGAATLAEASASLLLSMQQGGVISKTTLINETKRRGILSSEIDPEAEKEAAAADGPPLGAMGAGAGGEGA